jgi:polyvinyl alcohol dehydrogenase (cytochrome)
VRLAVDWTVSRGVCSSAGMIGSKGAVLLVVLACVMMVPPVAAARPRKAIPSPNRKDWAIYGHDFSNTRLNPREKRINRRSVARLTASWMKDGLVGVSGTPTVFAGVAYFGDWKGTVWAVDAKTGQELWHSQIGGFIVGAPAIDGDAVYVSSGATLYRLDRATGAQQWKVVTNENPFAQINASPVVVDGLVLQGVASFEVTIPRADYTFRGSIGAYDAETGAEAWRLYTTPDDPMSGAGVGIWSTPAVDVKRGLLYVGSGNTYAQPTAPLADSILAIDYKTGALRWSTQFTYPDVFSAGNPGGKDADVGASPNLWRSKGRSLVGAGDKAGVYHALDRDTGAVVWETMLTPGSFFGGEIGSGALVDRKLVVVSNVGNASNAPTNRAKVFALDPDSGEILWEAEEFPGLIFGPVGAVRGVAFVGTDAGTFAALDTRTGERLWTYEAPARTGCGPSIVNGRVLWGYGFTLFSGPGKGGIISFAVGR